MNNLLSVDKEVKDIIIRSVITKIRSQLPIFQSGIPITKVKAYGNILVGLDPVSVFISDFDKVSGSPVLRVPLIGKLIHVEKQLEYYSDIVELDSNGKPVLDANGNKVFQKLSINPDSDKDSEGNIITAERRQNYDTVYYIFYQTSSGVIVDKVTNDVYQGRRNLSLNSKFEIDRMCSSSKYVLVIDTDGNIEVISKKDIYSGDYSQVLTSRSYVLNRADLFSSFSRLLSGFYSADIVVNEEGIVILVVGGARRNVYKVVLDPKSLKPVGSVQNISRILGSGDIDLKAVLTFENFLLGELLPSNKISIISAASDSKYRFISFYNAEIGKYEHVVLKPSSEYPGYLTIARFTTDSSFSLRKVIELEYPGQDSKLLCFDINNSGTFTKYILIDKETCSISATGSTKISEVECSMLTSTMAIVMDNAPVKEEILDADDYIE